jgi:hypothetical protein
MMSDEKCIYFEQGYAEPNTEAIDEVNKEFDAFTQMINDSLSLRAKDWIEFSMKVLAHIEGYAIPQYGDKGADQITNWTAEECLKAVKKRLDRYGRNSRDNQQELDFMKMAHEVQLAYDKYLEAPEEADVCEWSSVNGITKMSGCENPWIFHIDTVKQMNFCPSCSKKIKVKS